MRTIQWLIVLAGCILATNGYSEEKKWADEAELSYVGTEGNTDSKTFSAKNTLKYKFTDKLGSSWKIFALYGETDGVRNAENFATELRVDYLFSKRFYSYLNGGWNKDTFAGIDSRYYVGPGAGYKILNGPNNFLLFEVGANYVTEEYTDDTDNDYANGRLFAKYEYAFTPKNKFSQSVEYLYDFDESDNYNVISETALISALSDYLSLKASHLIKYDNQPVPVTLERQDTVTSVALLVNF